LEDAHERKSPLKHFLDIINGQDTNLFHFFILFCQNGIDVIIAVEFLTEAERIFGQV
jgi:hypothetical protein